MALCPVGDAPHPAIASANSPARLSGSNPARSLILQIASGELGVREASGQNDGERVEQYLAYTGLDKGYAWCAAFVSWSYGQAGFKQPRNPWSPALFPTARQYCRSDDCRLPETIRQIQPADVFGIYGQRERRIIHVGLVQRLQGSYILTIEGNSEDRVQAKRRHLSTVYALANWLSL